MLTDALIAHCAVTWKCACPPQMLDLLLPAGYAAGFWRFRFHFSNDFSFHHISFFSYRIRCASFGFSVFCTFCLWPRATRQMEMGKRIQHLLAQLSLSAELALPQISFVIRSNWFFGEDSLLTAVVRHILMQCLRNSEKKNTNRRGRKVILRHLFSGRLPRFGSMFRVCISFHSISA